MGCVAPLSPGVDFSSALHLQILLGVGRGPVAPASDPSLTPMTVLELCLEDLLTTV